MYAAGPSLISAESGTSGVRYTAAAAGMATLVLLLYWALGGSTNDAEELGWFVVFFAFPFVILSFLCGFCLWMGRETSRPRE